MNTDGDFSGGIIVGMFIGIIAAFLGFLLYIGPVSISVYEQTMVKNNLAHFDEKTKEFVTDSLEFKNDTIIIRKKSN